MNKLNSSVDDAVECPLCMEPFEVDDLSFFPCTCGYQICRFCWHRIRTDENQLCPACRKEYPENPADFKPLTQEEIVAFKSQKRQRDQQRKQKITENRKHLANVRVVQKNLVFVVGLPPRLADADILKKHEYFGKYGKIHKVVINPSTTYAGVQGPSASAYVTYVQNTDALRAIQSVNNITIDGRQIKTSLGTTKYCSHFMKNQQCPKGDCMYLHELGDSEASFTKEEMHQGKHQEYEKRLHDMLLASAGPAGCIGVGVGNGSATATTVGSLLQAVAGVCPVSGGGVVVAAAVSKTLENSKSSSTISGTATTIITNSTSTSSSNKLISSNSQKEAWPSLSVSPVNHQKDALANSQTAGGGGKQRKERSSKLKNEKANGSTTQKTKNKNSNSNPTTTKDIDAMLESSGVVALTKSESCSFIQQKTLESSSLGNKEKLAKSNRNSKKKDSSKDVSRAGRRQLKEHSPDSGSSSPRRKTAVANFIANTNEIASDNDDNDDDDEDEEDDDALAIEETEDEALDSNRNLSTPTENSTENSENSEKNYAIGSIDAAAELSGSNLSANSLESVGLADEASEQNTAENHQTEISNILMNSFEKISSQQSMGFHADSRSSNSNTTTPDDESTNKNSSTSASTLVDNTHSSMSMDNNKLSFFDENSLFLTNPGGFDQSILLKNRLLAEQHSNLTAPLLPDLIKDIGGYQNSLTSINSQSDWEEALKNVGFKSSNSKQLEDKLQQQQQEHHAQHHQLQQQMQQHEELQRLQELHKHNNLLNSNSSSASSSSSAFNLSNLHADLQHIAQQTFPGNAELNRHAAAAALLQQPMLHQQQLSAANDPHHHQSLYGTNMSKFFDFHKSQQQKMQQQHTLHSNPASSNMRAAGSATFDNFQMLAMLESGSAAGAANHRLNPAQVLEHNLDINVGKQKQSAFGNMDQLMMRGSGGGVGHHHSNSQNDVRNHMQQQQNPVNSNNSNNINTKSSASVADDDLGFDPFIETQKALAELIENEENQQQQNVAKSMHQQQQQQQQHHDPLQQQFNLGGGHNPQHSQQQHQQNLDIMSRSRMPPPGFSHVSSMGSAASYGGGGGIPNRLQQHQHHSKLNHGLDNSNTHTMLPPMHHLANNTWGNQLMDNFQQHDDHLRPVIGGGSGGSGQHINGMMGGGANTKSYIGNDWTAMDPAILSFRQFSFPQQNQMNSHVQQQQQHQQHHDLFAAQQLLQQQPGFNLQSQLLNTGSAGNNGSNNLSNYLMAGNGVGQPTQLQPPNSMMNPQQQQSAANVNTMLEYLKTRQFL